MLNSSMKKELEFWQKHCVLTSQCHRINVHKRHRKAVEFKKMFTAVSLHTFIILTLGKTKVRFQNKTAIEKTPTI